MNDSHANFSNKIRHRVYLLLVILAVIAIVGIVFRIYAYVKLKYVTEQQSLVTVAVIKAQHGPKEEDLVFPGNILAWHEATLFARTSGFVTSWYFDIGAKVKAGTLLALISTPEVDAQLAQTEAQLKTAEANYALAKTTAARWLNLLRTQSVSQQETDEKVSNEKAQAEIVASTRANRDRLQELVNFERVVAPFDGIITSRTVDIGRLISAGNVNTLPLFRIAQSDKLRVYVRVPQNDASRIKPGLIAKLYLPQYPGKIFVAKLIGTAEAIDLTTRTLLSQFEIDNPKNELLPGSYTQIHLLLPVPDNVVRIPVNTLIFQKNGLQVAVLTEDNKAILKSIVVGRDFGNEVEVVAGLKPGATIILNPPDSLISGQKVRVANNSKGSV